MHYFSVSLRNPVIMVFVFCLLINILKKKIKMKLETCINTIPPQQLTKPIKPKFGGAESEKHKKTKVE